MWELAACFQTSILDSNKSKLTFQPWLISLALSLAGLNLLLIGLVAWQANVTWGLLAAAVPGRWSQRSWLSSSANRGKEMMKMKAGRLNSFPNRYTNKVRDSHRVMGIITSHYHHHDNFASLWPHVVTRWKRFISWWRDWPHCPKGNLGVRWGVANAFARDGFLFQWVRGSGHMSSTCPSILFFCFQFTWGQWRQTGRLKWLRSQPDGCHLAPSECCTTRWAALKRFRTSVANIKPNSFNVFVTPILQIVSDLLLPSMRYNHFWRTYTQIWSGTLKFLAPSTHGCCDTCADLKEDFRRARDTRLHWKKGWVHVQTVWALP